MNRKCLYIGVALWSLFFSSISLAWVKGIYVSQPTLESSGKLRYLIDESKSVGINTFVVDVNRKSRAFERNIQLLKQNGINFVARIVVFPNGGSVAQVEDDSFWQRRMGMIDYAIDNGAKKIQLDYIRYHTRVKPAARNAHDISEVIDWFRDQVHKRSAKLEVAVFGETSYKPSLSIGQNVKVFAPNIDSLAPMLYPSHWEPYTFHSKNPYKTVFDSLEALDQQFGGEAPFPVIAYIETSNYRYRIEGQERLDYIHAQLKAVEDAEIDGWYAWSASNYYQGLFRVLHHYTQLR